ncbi:hypothetical protein [Virgibacillus ainsalahensis]
MDQGKPNPNYKLINAAQGVNDEHLIIVYKKRNCPTNSLFS